MNIGDEAETGDLKTGFLILCKGFSWGLAKADKIQPGSTLLYLDPISAQKVYINSG